MTDIEQLQTDAHTSASRRFPNLSGSHAIDKIIEEVKELVVEVSRIPQFGHKRSRHCYNLSTVEEELADVILACLVFAKLEGLDMDRCLNVKNEFNKTRP